MRKSFAVAVGCLLAACGGAAEQPKAPETPAAPVASAPTPVPAATAEAPKEEPKPQPSAAELQKMTMMAFGEAMNAGDAKKLASLFTEGAVLKTAGMPDATGREAISAFYGSVFAAAKDVKSLPTRVWMKGDVVIAEWAMKGTHTGDWMGIKATEKPFGMTGVDVMWFTPEGLIKEAHSYVDIGTMMSHIGVSKQKARAIPTLPSGQPTMVASTGDAAEQKNVEAANKWMGAFEKKSDVDFLANAADDVAWDDMSQPEGMKGKDAGKKWFKTMTTAFPDAKMTATNVWGIGDYVIAEGAMTGTHKGALGPVAPTKKAINLHALDVIQFSKDGKIAHGWTYANSAEMMTQLGLLPMPGAAKADAPKAPAKTDAKASAKADAPKAPAKTDAKAPAKTDAKAPAKTDAKAPAKK